MKSDIIKLKKKADSADMAVILEKVEKIAKFAELDEKQSMHLRFLAEELIGMQRGLLGAKEAEMYIENEGNDFKICLHTDIELDFFEKERMVEVSKEKRNEAYKGLKGKILKFADAMIESSSYGLAGVEQEYFLHSESATVMGMYDRALSLNSYYETVPKDKPEWDMLERSILGKLADDIIVATRNTYLDLIIVKKF